jgi:hypothetical protein
MDVNAKMIEDQKKLAAKQAAEKEEAEKQRRIATNQGIEAGAAQYGEEVRKRYAELTPEQITQVSTTGPAEMQEVLKRRESALAGYQAPELAAMQSQMAGTQQAAQQQRERALQAALAKQGVRGGAAASLQAQASQMAAREQAQQSTDLMLKQAQRQREALGEYETGVQSALGAEQARLASELGVKLAAEQAAEAERARLFQEESQRQYSEDQKEAAKAGGGGCVIATHAVQNGAFHIRDLAEAKKWCEAALHEKWWGEAMRRGYRWLGRRAISRGKASEHYSEFKRYVRFGNGRDRSLKAAITFAMRSVQMFVIGLFVKD